MSVALADLVELPAARDEEADVEGLDRQGPWPIGSHSLKRKKVRPGDSPAKARKRHGKVVREANRYVLVRMPVDPATGLPVRELELDGQTLTAAVLGAHDDSLTDHLADEPLLAPFGRIPSKDNGIDVEGVAVHSTGGVDRLYVGFRGPLLRGWAVVVEVRLVTHPDDPHRLALGRFDDGERHRLHLLDLRGLGVRDLCPDGDDLLVLAGPSMGLSGPVRVHRWQDACVTDAAEVVPADQLPAVLDLLHGDGEDHAEGIALLPEPDEHGHPRLLVVYDSPAASRHAPGGGRLADVVDLPR